MQKLTMSDPFTIAAAHLNEFQVKVYDECIAKGSGGMSLPMGSGKTFLSLLVALEQVAADERILVVCSKSLLASWELEIKQFFGDSLRYEVLHREYTRNMAEWEPKKKTRIVITNIDTVARSYTTHELATRFIHYEPIHENNPNIVTAHYNPVNNPYVPGRVGVGYLHATRWGCLIVDEVQDYTNINTKNCQALGAVCAKHRWLLSGTIFNEPDPNRILGYHIILNYPDFPRNLPEAKRLIYTTHFRGLRRTVVHRAKNEAYTPPQVKETIVSHRLSEQEAKIYLMMKAVLIELKNHLQYLKRIRAVEDIKRFSSYLLAMLTYLREGLVCPIIPLTSVAIDMADFSSKNELSEILTKKLREMELNKWLADRKSVKSTRICKVVKHIDKHPDEQIIIFSCFRCAIDILRLYLPKKRKNYTLTGNMTGERRGEVISQFRKSKNGILLLTYDIGSQGLNLQTASTVMLLDYWWNAGKTNQAIARILRFGQRADTVNVYFFSSNTGVENAILEKQRTKLLAVEELQHGQQLTSVHKMRIQDIIRLIEMESNEDLLRNIYTQ